MGKGGDGANVPVYQGKNQRGNKSKKIITAALRPPYSLWSGKNKKKPESVDKVFILCLYCI
jgi:hypothetical protein